MSVRHLVLFNGGLKSTFLAALAKREGDTILCYFTLNREDERSLPHIERLAEKFGLQLLVKDLTLAPLLNETLLRMLYLVLHALPFAKENYCDCIYHGLSKDDDRRIIRVMDAYVKQLNSLIELAQPLYNDKGHWLGQVSLETPLRYLVRGQVIRLGNEYQIPWKLTNSCDKNAARHCGTCKACRRRQVAFAKEGHEDPTKYLG